VALTESVLARIEAVEPKVQSYLTLDREGALRQAEKADIARKNGQGGPLCGIPLAIKDVLCTTTMPTTMRLPHLGKLRRPLRGPRW
jgi:Asp-tRNAAsn/Glu-tRNAGln amidotransferase A subunit and related amidases